MRLLHYIPTYAPAWSFGGPVRSVSSLCEGLAGLGCEVHVLTTMAGIPKGEGIAINEPVQRNGVNVVYYETIPGMGIASPSLEKAVQNVVRDYDLVHITGVWQRTATAACRAASKAGVPYVVSPRGALSRYSWAKRRWKKSLYYLLAERRNIHEAAGIHYTSEMEFLECRPYQFPGRTVVIPNGLDFSFWDRRESNGQQWREGLKIPDNSPVAIYSGRIHHKKNLDFLLPLLKSLPEWHLAVAGFDEGGEAGRWLHRAEQAGVSNQILMLGSLSRDDLRAAYSASSAFLLPSHHENFANSALEAAACGCPLFLSTEVGLGKELQKLGRATVLPMDHPRWVSALKEMPVPAGTARDCREALISRFSKENTARQMLDYYHQLLKGDLL